MFALPLDARASDRVVKDFLGRDVVVPENPQRVVALAPSITEIVFALAQEHRLAGVTRFSDFPEKAQQFPKVGSYIQLDLERIVSLRPDLCLAIKDGNPKAVVDRLDSLGIPVYVVNPSGLESVMETLVEIGDLLHAEREAQEIVLDIQRRRDVVIQKVAESDLRPRVFFQIGISPIVSAGSSTFIHELIVMAGGENLAAGRAHYPRFSREQVIGLAPDVIIITSMARKAVFEKVKAEWQQWEDLPAAKHDRIYLQESNIFDRPTPRLVEGLELLARLIHPEIFKDKP